jgi:hypothetical protein
MQAESLFHQRLEECTGILKNKYTSLYGTSENVDKLFNNLIETIFTAFSNRKHELKSQDMK